MATGRPSCGYDGTLVNQFMGVDEAANRRDFSTLLGLMLSRRLRVDCRENVNNCGNVKVPARPSVRPDAQSMSAKKGALRHHLEVGRRAESRKRDEQFNPVGFAGVLLRNLPSRP